MPENKKINGIKFKINVGDFIRVKMKTFKKKLLFMSFPLKKTTSSTNVNKIIKDEIIAIKIIKDKENSFIKYLIKIFGVNLFILKFQFLKI